MFLTAIYFAAAAHAASISEHLGDALTPDRRRLVYEEVVCVDFCTGYAINCVMGIGVDPGNLEGEIKPCVRQTWDPSSDCARCVKRQDRIIGHRPSCGYENGVDYVGFECDADGNKICVFGSCLDDLVTPVEPEDTPAPIYSPEHCNELYDKLACKEFGCAWESGLCVEDVETAPEVRIAVSSYRTRNACQTMDESKLVDDVLEIVAGVEGTCHNLGVGKGSIRMRCGEDSGSPSGAIHAEFYEYGDCLGSANDDPLLRPQTCYESTSDRGKSIYKLSQFTPPSRCIYEEDNSNPTIRRDFENFRTFAESQTNKSDCKQVSGKWKNGACTVKSARKVKCKKLKLLPGLCESVGCTPKRRKDRVKCSGSPAF